MALISLKRYDNNVSIALEEGNILLIEASANGSVIEYRNTVNGLKDSVEVVNTPAEIASVSENLITITVSNDSPSTAIYINHERIRSIYEADSLARVVYDKGNNDLVDFKTTHTVTVLMTKVFTKQGYLTYNIESFGATTIVLPAATGDVSAKFQATEIVTLYGSAAENNGMLTVASVAFGGGKTTITLVAGVADDTDTTGVIMIKA